MSDKLKTKVLNCKCGKTFSIQPDEQMMCVKNGEELPTLCIKCREKQKDLNKINNANLHTKEELQNKIIKCKRCGKDFNFTVGEQKFYKERNYEEPNNCSNCRRIIKQRKQEAIINTYYI